MDRVAIVLAAIAPPQLILGYGIAKARSSWNSEATLNAFLLGAVSALAAIACELALGYLVPIHRMPPISGAATEAVLIAAIPEETIKFLVLLCLALKHVDVCRQQDILVLSLAVSLGFATLENFFFVISVGEWKITAALRAITSVPGHGIDGMAMGALLIAAWSSGQTLWRFSYALIVPVILHAAYDFPLLALKADLAQVWFGAAWLAIIAVSSLFVIALCNRALTAAAAADRASGRDVTSVETTDRLIAGGILAMLGGPLLAAFAFNANGSVGASAATVLSIFPIAFGIDSIRTGLARRKIRLARAAEAA